MSAIDIEQLLQPISADAPCGDDLEYDPAFGELERAAQGKPERVLGDQLTAILVEDVLHGGSKQ